MNDFIVSWYNNLVYVIPIIFALGGCYYLKERKKYVVFFLIGLLLVDIDKMIAIANLDWIKLVIYFFSVVFVIFARSCLKNKNCTNYKKIV